MTERDPRIAAALDDLAPALDRDADWGDVARRAAPKRRARTLRRGVGALATAGGLAALAGLIAVLVVATPDGDSRAPAAAGEPFSILTRERTTDDALPAWVIADPVFRSQRVNPASARRVIVDGERGLWAAISTRRDVPVGAGPRARSASAVRFACLVDAALSRPPGPVSRQGRVGSGGAGGIACVPVAAFAGHALVVGLTRVDSPGGYVRGDVAGLVPNGYALAEAGGVSAPVIDNVFLLKNVSLDESIRVTGAEADIVAPPPEPRSPGYTREVPPGNAVYSVFSRAARPADRLPPEIVELLKVRRARDAGGRFAPMPAIRPLVAKARFAGEFRGRRYWLVPDAVPSVVTIATLHPGGNRNLTGATLSRDRGILWAVSGGQRHPLEPFRLTLRAVVPDGYTSIEVDARKVPVKDNFVVIHDVPAVGSAVARGADVVYEEPLAGFGGPMALRMLLSRGATS